MRCVSFSHIVKQGFVCQRVVSEIKDTSLPIFEFAGFPYICKGGPAVMVSRCADVSQPDLFARAMAVILQVIRVFDGWRVGS